MWGGVVGKKRWWAFMEHSLCGRTEEAGKGLLDAYDSDVSVCCF